MEKSRMVARPQTFNRNLSQEAKSESAWLTSINPLRSLTASTAQMIFDASRRGNDVRLQWLYNAMEQVDPTLLVCAERRAGALVGLDWTIKPKTARRVRGYDQVLADEQVAALEAAYGECGNLFQAVEHLSSAFFRGHAHVAPIFSASGNSIEGFDLLNAWNFSRDITSGTWYWNPGAVEVPDVRVLDPVPPGEVVTVVRSRHIDYPAMAIYLRNALGESAWGRFLERYGVPPVIITMPPDIDPGRVDQYREAAEKVADGGSGALPYGSLVSYATDSRGVNPFKDFVDHQQQLVVLMATGGVLTSLTGATGIGQGASGAHEETWRSIVRRDSAIIASSLNKIVSSRILDSAFPGRQHLADFDFETESKPSPSEVFTTAGAAVTAGYRVTQRDLEERTGYELEPVPSAQPAMMPMGIGMNRARSDDPDLREVKALSEAMQIDLTPAADAVREFLKAPTQAGAAILISQLKEMLPEDLESAAILEEAIARAYLDALDDTNEVYNRKRGECHAKKPCKMSKAW